MSVYSQQIQQAVRTISDWPKPGIQFSDITPLMHDPKIFRMLIDSFVQRYQQQDIQGIAALDARGFLLGAPLAYELGLTLVPIRKQGKLPYDTISQSYELEYGSATVELHTDAFKPGDKVLVIDDLIATGGTMLAACELIQRLGAEVIECAAIIDLPALGGSQKIRDANLPIYSICEFD